MEKKLEIKKLADVVVWADNEIEELKEDLTEEEFEDCDEAKDLEVVKKVVLDAINRHITYTNALNKNIAERDAKIEKLEKELEHRRNMTDDENCVMNSLYDEIARRTEKINELTAKVANQKENLGGINETLETRTKENARLNEVIRDQTREIEAHEAENARLTEKIKELKGTNAELSLELDNYKDWNAGLRRDLKTWKDLANMNKDKACEAFKKKIAELEKENGDYAIRVNNLTEALEKTYAEKEADLKNHNRRDMNLVDELAGKNDKIKSLVEEIEYYKSQERIRTNQLRATESKVEQLYKEIEQLKEEDDHGRKGFERYIEHALKEAEGEIKDKLNKRFSEEISKISLKKTEKELAKMKVNESLGSGIPCGEDSIE